MAPASSLPVNTLRRRLIAGSASSAACCSSFSVAQISTSAESTLVGNGTTHLREELAAPFGGHHGWAVWTHRAFQQQDLLAGELRVVLARGGEALFDGGNERLHLVVLEHRLADGARLVLPRLEERVLTGLRDRRGDGCQPVVGVAVEAGVGGNDQVGPQRRDRLHRDAVDEVEHHRLRPAEFRLRPGPYAERLAAEPVGHRDRDDADGEQVVLSGEARADHPLGRRRDFSFAEHMFDGDRAVVGDLAGLRSAGGRERRRPGGQRQETPSGQRSRHPARVANSPENCRTTRRPGRARRRC